MAIVVCELCGDYDVGAWDDEILLWSEEAGMDSIACADDTGGDSDDVADCTILLWRDFTNFGGGEFVDIADFAVGDGGYVRDRSGGWFAWYRSGGGVVRNFIIKVSYCSGGVVWRDETVFGGGAKVSRVGVWDVWNSSIAICD